MENITTTSSNLEFCHGITASYRNCDKYDTLDEAVAKWKEYCKNHPNCKGCDLKAFDFPCAVSWLYAKCVEE